MLKHIYKLFLFIKLDSDSLKISLEKKNYMK